MGELHPPFLGRYLSISIYNYIDIHIFFSDFCKVNIPKVFLWFWIVKDFLCPSTTSKRNKSHHYSRDFGCCLHFCSATFLGWDLFVFWLFFSFLSSKEDPSLTIYMDISAYLFLKYSFVFLNAPPPLWDFWSLIGGGLF